MKRWIALYLVIGLAIYAPILPTWFVADDWDFLLIADRATGPMVAFTPLLGRFMRPLEMLTYYANYVAFGLHPLPYHLTVVLLHIANTAMVAALALRLGAPRATAFASGLIFLVFGGHTEAITWLGGAADAWLATFLVGGLLLFDRALEAQRPALPLIGAAVVFSTGFLAKESFAVAPALAVAYAGCRMLAPDRPDLRRIVARTLVLVAITSAAVLGSMFMRARLFGSVFGAYDELSRSGSMIVAVARAFVLRSFLPSGRVATWLWIHTYDVAILAAGVLLLGWLLIRSKNDRRALVFLPLALAITLAPALPLTISLQNTVSERYIYTPSVFSCILMAWVPMVLWQTRRFAAFIMIALIVVVHARAVLVLNRAWIEAAEACRAVTSGLIDVARSTTPETQIYVLNVPDTIRGAFSIRGAFHNSFHLMAREVAHPEHRVRLISSTMDTSIRNEVRVTPLGPRRFAVILDQGLFAQPLLASAPDYTIEGFTSQGFIFTLPERPQPIRLMYTSRGTLRDAGTIKGSAQP